MPEQAEENRIKKLLKKITKEKAVGMSGLALLCGATVFALSNDPNAALMGGIGSNVLAAMLQQHFEKVRDLPTKDETERLAAFAKSLTPEIEQNQELRQTIGAFLEENQTLDIAMALVEENPVQVWMLTHILNDLRAYRQDFDRSFENQAQMLANQVQIIARLDANNEDDEALIPYLEMVARRSERLPLAPLDPAGGEHVNIALNDVFVSLKVGAAITLETLEAKGKTWMGSSDAALAYIHAKEQLVLLGDAGSGKSTLLRYLSFCLAQFLLESESGWLSKLRWKMFFVDLEDAAQRTKQPGQTLETYLSSSQTKPPEPVIKQWQVKASIPVLVELREFARTDFDPQSPHALWRYVEKSLANEEIDSAIVTLKKKAQRGEILLMLDGVDEVPNEKRQAVWQAIQSLREGPYGGNRWIATCRGLSFVPQEAPVGVPVQTIQPLDQAQIDQFIEKWTEALRERGELTADEAKTFRESLQEATRDRLQELAPNPMLLTIIVLVQKYHGTLPKERARLYDACVEIMMLRWQHHKEKADGKTVPSILAQLGISKEDFERLLWELAWQAHSKNPEAKETADIAEADILRVARKPQFFNNDLEKIGKFINYTKERAHLLSFKGGVDEPIYTFPHRTFQEFLAARSLLVNRRLHRIIGELAAAGAAWREVLNLAAGILVFNENKREAAIGLIEAVMPQAIPTDVAGWHRVWLAGEMAVVVSRNWLELDEVGQEILPELQTQLGALLAAGALTPQQRAEAGVALAQLGDTRPDVACTVPQMVDVPAGPFLMGSKMGEDAGAFIKETPQHEVTIPAFRMGKYPVTNAQFAHFVQDGGYDDATLWTKAGWQQRQENAWNRPRYDDHSRYNQANQPVVGVSWYEAVAYCNWLSRKEGCTFRLPDEAMWEKAARGTDGRIYPWGNEWNPAFLNASETNINQPSAVGIFRQGVSPYGAYDMSGNVWEWCSTTHGKEYPFHAELYEQEIEGENRRRLRGGAFYFDPQYSRAAFRFYLNPLSRLDFVGFRVAEHLSDSVS